MEMSISDVGDDVVNVAPKDRLDTPGVDHVETTRTNTIVPRGAHTLMDLSGVEFGGSMAIRTFMTLARDIIAVEADADAALRVARG